MNSPAANTNPPHCCHCTCTIRRWNLRPDLRPADFDELVEHGLIAVDALAVPLRSVAS
jgi:hypothetical protein